jgi:hypothetical protein
MMNKSQLCTEYLSLSKEQNLNECVAGKMRSRLEHKGFGAGVGKPVGKLIFNKNAEPMKTYYAIVNVEERRLGTYVRAEHVAAAFETATARDKARHPRLQVETIAV